MKAIISKNFTPDTVFKQNLHGEQFFVRSRALDQEEQKGDRSLGEKYLPVFLDSKHIPVCIYKLFPNA
jgi:hypothetical protein